MAETYKTVQGESTGEIEEKRSRFIATIRHIESQEDALAFYEEAGFQTFRRYMEMKL